MFTLRAALLAFLAVACARASSPAEALCRLCGRTLFEARANYESTEQLTTARLRSTFASGWQNDLGARPTGGRLGRARRMETAPPDFRRNPGDFVLQHFPQALVHFIVGIVGVHGR